jgi:hypothetical protein
MMRTEVAGKHEYRSGHYRLMLRNRLFFNFKGAYMKYNLLYMKNMLTGHLEVV